ncbi:MAG TPA: aminotransferase class V-fold PLP-dependent enzyme [Planctomycetota bacterium]|jgi:cysteine desulfurase|nr:aminotransferase class V-fold PLP-dependent enzyme [Planctomycetota bacterium]
MRKPIYLDHHATTPVDPRVVEAMLPFFTKEFGNAASRTHPFGHKAAAAVEEARGKVASLVGAEVDEIVFASGATESDNLAIKGSLAAARGRNPHLVTNLAEHNAVLDPCRRLEREGCRVTFLAVDRFARVDPESVRAAIGPETLLVSVMAANNEVGTLQPTSEIARICRERGVLFHTDATQAAGKVPLDLRALGVDLASFSAHKIYGPKGVGALFVRKGVRLKPLIDGGGHEKGLRSGTLNVPGIVGFGRAAEICRMEMAAEAARVRALRDRLERLLFEGLDFVTLNGHPEERLPGNLNVSFAFLEAEALMAAMEEVAVSSGAACTSASREPSHVLGAMGVERELAEGSIRYGIGRFNTEEEIDHAARRTIEQARRLRALSPLYEIAVQAGKGGAPMRKPGARA